MSDGGSTPCPTLRFLPIGEIRPHEVSEGRRAADLSQRIAADGVLRNPVTVAELAPREYVLIDGTHRYESLAAAGYDALLAQVAPLTAPTVIDTWCHAARVDEARFLDDVAAAGLDARPLAPDAAEAALAGRQTPLSFALAARPDAVYTLAGAAARAPALRAFVALYQPRRVACDELLAHGGFDPGRLFGTAPCADANLLVRFAAFDPGDIVALARSTACIPAGITRFVLGGGRLLGVDAPVRLLTTSASADERRSWLDHLARRRPRRFAGPARVHEPRPRHYTEPLIVYDPTLVVEPA